MLVTFPALAPLLYVESQREGRVIGTGGFSLIGCAILSLSKKEVQRDSFCLVALSSKAKLFLAIFMVAWLKCVCLSCDSILMLARLHFYSLMREH